MGTMVLLQAIGVGLLLGLIQLLLLLLGIERLGLRPSLCVGLLFYLLIPLLTGLRTAQQIQTIPRGIVADLVTGGVSSLVFLLPFFLNLLTTGHFSVAPHRIPLADVPTFTFAVVVTILAFLLTSLGVLLALAGGAIGRAFGKRWMTRAAHSERRIEHAAAPTD
jgi:hypothetical protein